MLQKQIRFLCTADSHLGFDFPLHPRVKRRHRGPDFFANFQRIIDFAVAERLDFIIHGGDFFFRSKIRLPVAQKAFKPLMQIADAGIPVFLVPGNHERSSIPFSLLASHAHIHIFRVPGTYFFEKKTLRVALTGFPNVRSNIRDRFSECVHSVEFRAQPVNCRILCMHQTVEGATVGPSNYTFRNGQDVIRCRQIPKNFDLIISGHIHRRQVLLHDLQHQKLPAPVIYPGSIERTSAAERNEPKGFYVVTCHFNTSGVRQIEWSFVELPTRPMQVIDLRSHDPEGNVVPLLVRHLKQLNPDSIVTVRIRKSSSTLNLTADIRCLIPETMTVNFRFFNQLQ